MKNLALLFIGVILFSSASFAEQGIYQPSEDLSDSIKKIQSQAEINKKDLDKMAKSSDSQIALLKKPDAQIGMTKYQVAQETKWGNPYDVNKTTTKYGVSEQWVYSSAYLYFENNKLVAIQEK